MNKSNLEILQLIALGGRDTYLVNFLNQDGVSVFSMHDFPTNKIFSFMDQEFQILDGEDMPVNHGQGDYIPEFKPVFCLCQRPLDTWDEWTYHFNQGCAELQFIHKENRIEALYNCSNKHKSIQNEFVCGWR